MPKPLYRHALMASCVLAATVIAGPVMAQPATESSSSPVEPTATPTDETLEPSSTNLAAENAQVPATGEDTIIVTGSRIRRPDFSTPNPVMSIGTDQILESGTTNVTDFLTGYPALQGSATSADNSGEDAAIGYTGLNLLNLRNLGTERTLVLVDGRRHVAGVPGSQSIDVNTIPSDLIERIDVLTGGASAIYGADGVSGVVNFVLKRNFEGLSVRGQAGISEEGDAGQRLFSITAGTNFGAGRGNFAIAYEHGEEDRFRYRQRERLSGENYIGFVLNPDDPENFPGYSGPNDNGIPDYLPLANVRYFDSTRGGGIDVDVDGLPDFDILPGGEVVRFDTGRFVPDFFQQGGSGTLLADYRLDLLPELDRDVVNAITQFQISPALTLFAEGKYARTKSFSLSQPTYDFYLLFPETNAFVTPQIRETLIPGIGEAVFGDPENPFGVPDFFLLNRDNFDIGIRGEDIKRETYRAVLGAKGDLGRNINYEASYVYGRTDVLNHYVDDVLTDRFLAAIDVVVDPRTGQPTCAVNLDPNWTPFQPFASRGETPPTTFQPGECVPLNLFGEGAPSQAAIDFVTADTTDRARLKQHVLSASVAGNLSDLFTFPGGGALGFAVGAEYRRESSSFVPDELSAQGLTFGNKLAIDKGKFNVKEAFGEVRLPLVRNQPFAHRLEVGGAIRVSDYSTVGGTTAWKADGAWAPIRDISFTGTYSKAVRAPNIGELFAGSSQTFLFITDPCNLNQVQNGSEFRQANCAALLASLGADPATYRDRRSTSLPGVVGSNPNLAEEVAKTWTVGTILQPRFIPGLTARVDWYDIKIEDAINTASAEELAQLCVDQPTLDNVYCSLIVRQSGSEGNAQPGNILDYTLQPFNVAAFRTAGLDLNLNYRLRTARAGTFSLNLIGNYLDKLEFVSVPGGPVDDDRMEAFAPKYTLNGDLTWKSGRYTLNYGLQWFSKTLRFSNLEMDSNPDVIDDEYRYRKERWQHDIYGAVDVANRFQFYGGINNVFDQKPDVGSNTYPVNSVGRFFFVGARVKLDKVI